MVTYADCRGTVRIQQKYGQNDYAYVGGDPVNYTDPSGLFVYNAAGAVYGAVAGAVGGYITGGVAGAAAGAVAGAAVGAIVPASASAVGQAAGAALASALGQAVGNATSGRSVSDPGNYSAGAIVGAGVGAPVGRAVGTAIGEGLTPFYGRVIGSELNSSSVYPVTSELTNALFEGASAGVGELGGGYACPASNN